MTKNTSCPCDNVLKEGGTCQCCHPDVIKSAKEFSEKKIFDEKISKIPHKKKC